MGAGPSPSASGGAVQEHALDPASVAHILADEFGLHATAIQPLTVEFATVCRVDTSRHPTWGIWHSRR